MATAAAAAPAGGELSSNSLKILEIKKMLKERDLAKAGLDYEKSDFLRGKLEKEYKIVIVDQNNGPAGFKFKDGSSNKLPSGYKVPPEYSEIFAKSKEANRKRGREGTGTGEKLTANRKHMNIAFILTSILTNRSSCSRGR